MKKILSSKVAAGVIVLLFLMGSYTRPCEACRLLKGHEGVRAGNNESSLIVIQSLQKGSTPCTGNCSGYTPGSSTTASTTGTKAFAGRSTVGVPLHGSSDRISRSGVAANRK
ncbi:hypothetical protein NL676_002767 [Syzygium grande]|nr:hypothetical protein NL676_002767 [Syzygium grande]